MGLIKILLFFIVLSFFLVTLSDYMHAVNDSLRAVYIMQQVTQYHMRDLEMRLRGKQL